MWNHTNAYIHFQLENVPWFRAAKKSSIVLFWSKQTSKMIDSLGSMWIYGSLEWNCFHSAEWISPQKYTWNHELTREDFLNQNKVNTCDMWYKYGEWSGLCHRSIYIHKHAEFETSMRFMVHWIFGSHW